MRDNGLLTVNPFQDGSIIDSTARVAIAHIPTHRWKARTNRASYHGQPGRANP